jgi:phage-related protein
MNTPHKESTVIKRRWRYYKTSSGKDVISAFLNKQSRSDAAEIVAELKTVRTEGLVSARHLEGDIYEVRVDGLNQIFRVLFSVEGTKGRVLLALEAFSKKTQKTPLKTMDID